MFTNSSTPASSYSTYATSYTSMSDQGHSRDRRHMNLDDPPPSSLRRTPSPGYSSSSHSQPRSLPHVGVNGPSSSASMSALSSSSQTNDQIRSLVEQPRIRAHHPPQISQVHPQPLEPGQRYTHGPAGFHASYTLSGSNEKSGGGALATGERRRYTTTTRRDTRATDRAHPCLRGLT